MSGVGYLLTAVIKAFILPLIATILVSQSLNLSWIASTLISLSCLPLVHSIRSHISLYRNQLHARRLGAVDISIVRGGWPLNLDVLVDWSKSGSEEEAGRMMRLLSRKYGLTYNTRVLGDNQILTLDPAVIKHVLNDDFGNFVKGQKFNERAQGFLGDGIFNSDGERWKFHRTFTRPHFHPQHVNPAVFTPFITRFLESLPTGAFDIQSHLGELALQMSIAWMCGVDISNDCSRGVEWMRARDGLGDALTQAQGVVGRRMKIGTLWPLFEFGHDPLNEPMKVIRTFFAPFIAEAAARQTQRERGETHLIDRLLEATDGDQKLVEDQLVNILLASRDTTSCLLTFICYVLALHPDVSDRIRREVLNVSTDGPITKEVIRECRAGRAFINETLRLFPPVPLNIRRSLKSSLLPNPTNNARPFYMPADTSVVMAPILMQRSTEVWGPNAEEFDLDRWLKPGGLTKTEREGFVSWNIGPRMCLGQPFALTVAHSFLILLFRYLQDRRAKEATANDLKIELVPGAQPSDSRVPEHWITDWDGRCRGGRDKVWVVADVVLSVKGGLWVKID